MHVARTRDHGSHSLATGALECSPGPVPGHRSVSWSSPAHAVVCLNKRARPVRAPPRSLVPTVWLLASRLTGYDIGVKGTAARPELARSLVPGLNMAAWLRDGRRAEVELLRRAQRSLRYELEVRRPGDGCVKERIEVLAHSTVHEAGDHDFARQRTAGGECIAGNRDIGAVAGQDRQHRLGRPAIR